jgi:hypothetical protein
MRALSDSDCARKEAISCESFVLSRRFASSDSRSALSADSRAESASDSEAKACRAVSTLRVACSSSAESVWRSASSSWLRF